MKTSVVFEQLLQCRKNIVSLIEKNEDILLTEAKGYKNNLLWNAAHCASTLQLLTYGISGNDLPLGLDTINLYRKGTSFDSSKEQIDIAELKEVLISSVEQVKKDYESGVFSTWKEYETSFGTTLRSVEDAILFNNIHEGIHLGYMLAQIKAIRNN